MNPPPQFVEKNTIYGYEQRCKHATHKGLSTLPTKEEVVLTDFTYLEQEILGFKSEKEFISTENNPTLAAKYISMAEKYDTMMIQFKQYVQEKNKRLGELETKNTQLEEQDKYNQGELENYINELDDNETAMAVMQTEHSGVINEFIIQLNKKQSLNYSIEMQLRWCRLYMIIIMIYSYLIGSYGLATIITQHYTYIVYYPVTMLLFVFKMLMDAVII